MNAALSVVISAAIKGSAVLGAACLLSFVLRRASAAFRHLLWTLAVVSLLALPILTLVLPAWEVQAVQDVLPAASSIFFTTQTTGIEAARPVLTGRQAQVWLGQRTPQNPIAVPDWLLTIWAAGALAGLGRLAIGTVAVKRLCRKATRLPEDGELARKLGIRREVRILQSDGATMPLTWGLIRPAILLPGDAAHWPEERRRMVLAHELAHIKRQDCLTQFLARIAFSLYWFNPLVWFAARCFLKERERACDDLVLSLGAKPSDYAAELLEVARSLAPPPSAAWATVTMARRSELEGRLLAILDSNLRRGFVGRLGLLGATFAAACFVLPLAAMRPSQEKAEQFYQQGLEAHLAKRFAEAEQFYLHALGTLGPNSLEAARIHNNLGILLASQGRYGEAERDYLNALLIEEKTPGAEGDVANTLQLYARLLRDTDRVPEAEVQEARATEMRSRHLQQMAAEDEYWLSREPAARMSKGEGMQPPVLVQKVEPAYSDLARLAKFQGSVLLYVEIGTDGGVHNVRVKRSLGLDLDEKAVEAVKKWTFQPGQRFGRPVTVAATIEVNFRLL
jgi:TonB family protein